MSHLLMAETLPEKVQTVMENRVGDCEICQDACPWNRKHLNKPFKSKMTESFQKSIKYWKEIFYLPQLVKLSENDYRKIVGRFNTGIPYKIFHRNVLIANERAKSYKNG
jgi:epoxyqueuosine reductase QueG